MDKATGMSKAQKTDKKRPMTAVVAEQPLTEAQWVCIYSTKLGSWDDKLTVR